MTQGLEQENAGLKRIAAEHAVDIATSKDVQAAKMVSAARWRDAIAWQQCRHRVSERRAFRLLGPHHQPTPIVRPIRRRRWYVPSRFGLTLPTACSIGSA